MSAVWTTMKGFRDRTASVMAFGTGCCRKPHHSIITPTCPCIYYLVCAMGP